VSHYDTADQNGRPGQRAGASPSEDLTIPPPGDEHVVYRAEDRDVVGARRKHLDIPATLGGALAALGALALLSGLIGAIVGAIGYQTGVDDQDLSTGGLIGGLAALFLACLLGGWVAGRLARHHGGLHGLIAVLWLVVLAAVLAVLAAVVGDRLDARQRVGLPDWFSSGWGTAAVISGLAALLLMLLGGWLGGLWGEKHRQSGAVEVVERRRAVRRRSGGIVAEGRR
jgi:hypothetical protein